MFTQWCSEIEASWWRAMIYPTPCTVYPKKYAHGFCFAVLCCGYTLTDFPISIRLTSLALWQSNDCPSASKATLMNMDKYFMWIHYERLHNHNKAKHNKTVCIFLGIYCIHSISFLKYIKKTKKSYTTNLIFISKADISIEILGYMESHPEYKIMGSLYKTSLLSMLDVFLAWGK